jgi:hypothetical protein
MADLPKDWLTSPPPQACNCIGPQRGEPFCPCVMRGVTVKNGRYVIPERDVGPVPDKTEDSP